MLLFETVAYATEATDATAAAGTASMLTSFLPLILIFAFMYFIMIRPQKKKEKALKEKISKMKVGDKATSIGGITGKINRIKDEFVILETGNLGTIDEKSFIKLEKSAIRDVQGKIEA